MSPRRIEREDLLADLQRVADELGYPPRKTDYRDHGEYAASTIQTRFDRWDRALAEAGLDPELKPNAATKNRPGIRVTCPQCGTDSRADAETRTQPCPDCDHVYQIRDARIAFLGHNTVIAELAGGPKTGAELSVDPDQQPGVVYRLKAPGRSSQTAKSRATTTIIYYLVGDERRAMDRFIQVNEAYVRDCLADSPNPLQHSWTDEEYQLLVEQFHRNGYADD